MKNIVKKPLIYFLFLINFLFLSSAKLPDDPLSGVWKGYVTQKTGGFAKKYDFEMVFQLKNDNRITGESRINMPNGIFAVMTLAGEKNNQKITIKELSIKEQKIEGGTWCIKKYSLLLKNNTLKGSWFGCILNSNTPEGEIYLERK